MTLTASQFMFYFFAFAIILFSVLTVTSRRILRAATYLLFVLISTAGIYFLLNYEFLAAVQITLYAGGIVVLIIFSILLTSQVGTKFDPISWKKKLASAIAVAAGAILTITTILQHQFEASTEAARAVEMRWIGLSLLSYEKEGFILPFEVISVLLLASMIGAIIIARKEDENKETKN